MKFKLGKETIRPTNDGGLGVGYINDDEKLVAWKGKIPILSIEVSLRSYPF